MTEPTGVAPVSPQPVAAIRRRADLLAHACRFATAIVTRAFLRLYHRFEVVGREHLPVGGGSFVLVANHGSHLDGLCVLSALPLAAIPRAFPVAARDYFFGGRAIAALAATLFNALPLDRGGNVRQSLSRCRDLLRRDGNVLIVFPEGTRSTSGAIGPFRRGVGDLVAGTNVPVVPCYLDGPRDAMPKGARFPRPRRVRLIVGPPRTYAHLAPGKPSARAIGQDLRRAVLALSPAGRGLVPSVADCDCEASAPVVAVLTHHPRPRGKAA